MPKDQICRWLGGGAGGGGGGVITPHISIHLTHMEWLILIFFYITELVLVHLYMAKERGGAGVVVRGWEVSIRSSSFPSSSAASHQASTLLSLL